MVNSDSDVSVSESEDFINVMKKLKFPRHYDADMVHPGAKEEMEHPDVADSPSQDRNPSPPPYLAEQTELLRSAESIGNTAFSKHWLFSTLMKLIEEVDRENEEGTQTDLMVDVDDELQSELCKLWDMSMNSEVVQFLEEFKAVDILTGIIQKSKAPRVTEISVGILGNMACEQAVCVHMAENHKVIDLMLLLLETSDAPTLVETTRLIYTSLSNTVTRGTWIKAIERSEEVLGHLKFIFSSSTNCDLLKNTAELVDTLLHLESDLCVSWATIDFIHSLLEATEQIGSNHTEALEVYLNIFQSLSTTESGVEALVSHSERLERKLMKYLNIVCDYEIVNVDGKEGGLATALSILNILLSTCPRKQLKMCEDERLIRIMLKILEPLYPMLQKFRKENRSNPDQPDGTQVDQVTSSGQSNPQTEEESKDSKDTSEKSSASEANDQTGEVDATTAVTDSDNEQSTDFKQLEILYEILSGFLVDYCSTIFVAQGPVKTDVDSNTDEVDSSNNASDDKQLSPKGDKACDSTKEDNSVETSGQGDNSEFDGKTDSSVEDSEEPERNNIKFNCLPVMTYLDESCSRCRINYFGLSLKETESGARLFMQLCELAEKHGKQRLSRVLNDVATGKIVNRADSCKPAEETVS